VLYDRAEVGMRLDRRAGVAKLAMQTAFDLGVTGWTGICRTYRFDRSEVLRWVVGALTT
jgi:hypothetical protein